MQVQWLEEPKSTRESRWTQRSHCWPARPLWGLWPCTFLPCVTSSGVFENIKTFANQWNQTHHQDVEETELDILLGIAVDVEHLFMCANKEEDGDTKQVYFLNVVLTNFVRFSLSTTCFCKRYLSSSLNCYGTPWRRQHHLYKSSLKSPHMRSPTLPKESPTLSSSNSNTCHQKNGKWCELLSKLPSTRQACTSKLLLSLPGLTWPICSSTISTTGTWRRQLPTTSKHLPRMSLPTRFWTSNWSKSEVQNVAGKLYEVVGVLPHSHFLRLPTSLWHHPHIWQVTTPINLPGDSLKQ